MKKYRILGMILALLLTSGCTSPNETLSPKDPTLQTETAIAQSNEKMFTDRDKKADYSAKNSIRIELNGNTATASSDSVRIDGSTVTITGEGTYILSGHLENGSIIVDAEEKDKLQLVLEGVSVSSEAAPLEIREADKVFVTLAEGTENTLSGSCKDAEVDGAVFSGQDLTFNGTGSLNVTSSAGHGIVCKDDLVFTGGSYQVQSASHGLDVNDSVRMTGETAMILDAGKDGIHCENADDAEKGFVYIETGTVRITAQGDGISAGAYAHILDGVFDIQAGGGHINGTKEHSDFFGGFMGGGRPGYRPTAQETVTDDSTSMKGLKAAGDIFIDDGSFVMDTADDCIHSNTSITVSDGNFDLSSGDDAFHADDTLTVREGLLNIKTSYEGLEAQKVYIHGGEMEISAKDDGINSAGGQDASGTEGGRDGMFGAPGERPMGGGRPGGKPGGYFGGGASDGVIEISGGSMKIYSSGDGMDANGSITVSGGKIYVANPSGGDTSVLDSDNGAVITGGSFIGAAASTMMAQSFSEASAQGVIACTVGNQRAGTPVIVQDQAGNELVSYDTEYDFVLVIISTPELQKGESYTLTVGEYTGPIQAK